MPVCVIIPARRLLGVGGGVTQMRFVRQLDEDEVRVLETMRRTDVSGPRQSRPLHVCVAERGRLHARACGKNWGALLLTKGTGHVLTFGRERCNK